MDINSEVMALLRGYTFLQERYLNLGTEIARLTAAGCINATEFWRDDKYLYLVSPMNGGRRKKRYIGNHPPRIKEARQKLANYSRRARLVVEQGEIEDDLARIDGLLRQAVKVCNSRVSSVRLKGVGEAFAACGVSEVAAAQGLKQLGVLG